METINQIKKDALSDNGCDLDESWNDEEEAIDMQEPFFSIVHDNSQETEENSIFLDEIEVLQDDSTDFYATSVQKAKEKKEKDFIADILDWMKELNETADLYSYQKEAVKQMKVLADTILER